MLDYYSYIFYQVNYLLSHISAEMSHFHDQKVTDFKNMMQHFLQEQIRFHQRVSLKVINLIHHTSEHIFVRERVMINKLLQTVYH